MEFKSQYFKLEEFTKSDKAIELGIDNTPNEEQLQNLQWLVTKILDPLRAKLGASIKINSGFRSEALNKAVGGTQNPPSQHLAGKASDIFASSMTSKALFNFIITKTELPFDQVILENITNPGWVHISYDREKNPPKKGILVAKLVDGKTKYFPYSA